MKLDLIQTYQTLVLIEEFTIKVENIKKSKQDILSKGIITEQQLKRWFIRFVIGLALIFLSLNLLFHGIKVSTLVLFPVHLMESLKWSIVSLVLVLIYNYIKKWTNQIKVKKQSFQSELEYYQTNLIAFQKALNYSIVPKQYQRIEIVKVMMKSSNNGDVSEDIKEKIAQGKRDTL